MTRPYYDDGTVTLWHGDCLDILRDLPDASVDAVVTDPPYGLEFMGKDWDAPWRTHQGVIDADTWNQGDSNPYSRARTRSGRGSSYGLADSATTGHAFQAWCEQWAAHCYRLLKPGGHLLAFGGTRTWHRLAVAVEDAGFEIRDSIAWLYGSGFPKSLDVSKAIDRAAGATREVVGSKLGLPGVSADGANYGRGFSRAYEGREDRPDPALDITAPATPEAQQWAGWGTALKPAFEPVVVARKPLTGTVAANVLTHGTGALNIDATRIHTPGSEAKPYTVKRTAPGATQNATGRTKFDDGTMYEGTTTAGRWPTNVALDPTTAAQLDQQTGVMRDGACPAGAASIYGTTPAERDRTTVGYGGQGGGSRYFPVFRYEAKAPGHERPRVDGEAHATVKPLDLMRWLVRLVCPPGGLVLDPFAGTGTTAEACIIEGARCWTIEREAAYLPLIKARLGKPIQPDLFGIDGEAG